MTAEEQTDDSVKILLMFRKTETYTVHLKVSKQLKDNKYVHVRCCNQSLSMVESYSTRARAMMKSAQ